ncbi:Ldh family oxidoreductase [Wohlfahrtiimonas chitiniclastica]|uniref:Ldh family oxidoreductase n=1 Tax=Wohlfahrtiimonas chitiniclastica TaxID=400946 RepID=UPI0007B414B8|nr:Ldh family oxidoreductase [Wohlfahrtiimonas chitiniclastica]KZS23164.1 hypothetical protein BMY_1008 [Wohlfahrtiimonas chitiniclastica]OYQ78357.1 oxidoreductase [Wohlfahrtiimonas chitiniclastica]WHR55590.1 Ldh family oxidoreductase [Wohlfahrtiimonas chitiniclastica]
MKISIDQLQTLVHEILDSRGFSRAHRDAITDNLMAAQIAECHSHGVWRLIALMDNLDKGMLNTEAVPIVTHNKGAIIRIDCQMAAAQYGHHVGMPLLIERAQEFGIALLAINHSIHFSALWVELEMLAKANLVGLCMTTSHAWVAPCGGKTPLLGTNPFAFAWPRADKNRPYIFDFATSATARGEIQLLAKHNQPLPDHCAIDADGNPTNDPHAALKGAMRTFGEHKGTALATMIELMAGPLINDLTSQGSEQSANGTALPYGGELIIAIDPTLLLGDEYSEASARAEDYLNQFTHHGVRLPSERRFTARDENLQTGELTLDDDLIEELKALIHPRTESFKEAI